MKKIYPLILCGFFFIVLSSSASVAQSILNPNDPIVEYNPAKTYAQPRNGKIGKWVRTSRHWNWNTDSYKAYIYKGVAFRLKFPKTYNPTAKDGKLYPMIVMFHGYGEVGPITDNEYQLMNGGQLHRDAVDNGIFDGYVLFMQCKDYWHDYHSKYITEIINYMVAHNKLDPFRVSVHGLSGGGWNTWESLIRYPQFFACAIPMSGISASYVNYVNKLKFTPIWYFQGTFDTNPNPATAHVVRDAMAKAGANFKYTKIFIAQHDTWDFAYRQPDFFPYMLRAYASNPWPLGGKTTFLQYPINITVGVPPGFSAYEWRKNGKIITNATSNTLQVTSAGKYEARVRRGTKWSDWSHTPVIIGVNSLIDNSNLIVSNELTEQNLDEHLNDSISAFPNPFTDHFTLSVPSHKSEKITVEVYDIYGKRIYVKNDMVEIGLNSLKIMADKNIFAAGIYTVKVIYENSKKVESLKLIKP